MKDITNQNVQELRERIKKSYRLLRENFEKTRDVIANDKEQMLQRLADAELIFTEIASGEILDEEKEVQALLAVQKELDTLRCYFGAYTTMPLSDKGIENVNPYLRILDMMMLILPSEILYAELLRISYAVIDYRMRNHVPINEPLLHRLLKSASLYMKFEHMQDVHAGNSEKLTYYFINIRRQLVSICEENEELSPYLYDFDLHFIAAVGIFLEDDSVFTPELTDEMIHSMIRVVSDTALSRMMAQRIRVAAGYLWNRSNPNKEQKEVLIALDKVARQVIENE